MKRNENVKSKIIPITDLKAVHNLLKLRGLLEIEETHNCFVLVRYRMKEKPAQQNLASKGFYTRLSDSCNLN